MKYLNEVRPEASAAGTGHWETDRGNCLSLKNRVRLEGRKLSLNNQAGQNIRMAGFRMIQMMNRMGKYSV